MTSIQITKSGKVTGPLLMIMAGALFAAANTAVQAAGMQYGVTPAATAFWQYAVALLIFAPMIVWQGWRTKRPFLHVFRVGLAAIGVQFWVMGLAVVPVWQAIALILTSPLFVTLGAAVFLGEKLTGPRLAAVCAGGIGGVVILAPWTESFTLNALLPVAAAAFWAGASVVTKRLSTTETASTLTLYLLVLLVPINGVIALGSGFAMPSAAIWVVVLAGAVTAGAQFALAGAYRLAEASYLQPFDHIKLPFNVLAGVVVFGFVPPGLMWLGATIILGSCFVLWLTERR